MSRVMAATLHNRDVQLSFNSETCRTGVRLLFCGESLSAARVSLRALEPYSPAMFSFHSGTVCSRPAGRCALGSAGCRAPAVLSVCWVPCPCRALGLLGAVLSGQLGAVPLPCSRPAGCRVPAVLSARWVPCPCRALGALCPSREQLAWRGVSGRSRYGYQARPECGTCRRVSRAAVTGPRQIPGHTNRTGYREPTS